MSTFQGSGMYGPIPPKVKSLNKWRGYSVNRYANRKPSEQKNTSGQRRQRRDAERSAQ